MYNQTQILCFTYVPPDASHNALTGGAVGGIIAGCIAFAILVLVLVLVVWRRRQKEKEERVLAAARAKNKKVYTQKLSGVMLEAYEEPVRRKISHLRHKEDGTYEIPLYADLEGTYALYQVRKRAPGSPEPTYEAIYGGDERRDAVYAPVYEVTYDELKESGMTRV